MLYRAKLKANAEMLYRAKLKANAENVVQSKTCKHRKRTKERSHGQHLHWDSLHRGQESQIQITALTCSFLHIYRSSTYDPSRQESGISQGRELGLDLPKKTRQQLLHSLSTRVSLWALLRLNSQGASGTSGSLARLLHSLQSLENSLLMGSCVEHRSRVLPHVLVEVVASGHWCLTNDNHVLVLARGSCLARVVSPCVQWTGAVGANRDLWQAHLDTQARLLITECRKKRVESVIIHLRSEMRVRTDWSARNKTWSMFQQQAEQRKRSGFNKNCMCAVLCGFCWWCSKYNDDEEGKRKEGKRESERKWPLTYRREVQGTEGCWSCSIADLGGWWAWRLVVLASGRRWRGKRKDGEARGAKRGRVRVSRL